MRKLLITWLCLTSLQAWGKNSQVLVDLGMAAGGVNFGGAYEYLFDGNQGIGGQLHMYSKDTSSAHPANGLLIIGAFTGYHFFKNTWDLSIAPGLNIINITSYTSAKKDATGLGPSVQLALTTQLNDRVAIGFVHSEYWVWFGDDYRGALLDDLNLRLKIAF